MVLLLLVNLSSEGDVIRVLLLTFDGRHFMCFDEDGPLTGYTLLSTGVTFFDSGDIYKSKKQRDSC